MLEHAKRYREADGILVNTFDAIEPEAANLLKKEEPGRAIVYTVGPLIRAHAAACEEGAHCLKWLNSQPTGSVLFVSFGSVGSLSAEQLRELALGLEARGQRFLWVVRSPIDLKSVVSDYVKAPNADNLLAYLPEGFLERTKRVGLVVPSWAPQVEVLAHSSTGGFLSHCGWNSTLESMARGVPMIVWPLFAEHRMNAVMMVEGAKVVMRLKARKDGVFDREEISRVVKDLMEGEEGERLRKRAKELEVEAAAAMIEGG